MMASLLPLLTGRRDILVAAARRGEAGYDGFVTPSSKDALLPKIFAI
jgi:hypothetical protein